MKTKFCMALIFSLLMSTVVFGGVQSNTDYNKEKNYIISGSISVAKSDENLFTNPYNTAKIKATAQGNLLTVLSGSKKINLQLNSPLYKLSAAYKDKIIKKNGIWGVERNIKKIVFDGSETWSLIDDYKFKNSNTTLFSTKLPDNVRLKSGLCTHFDVSFNITDKSNIYDGVSFDGEDVYIRIMNVRNIKDTDSLKKYLINQKKYANPLTLYYIDETPDFEPFDDGTQKELNSIDFSHVGFIDKLTPIVELEEEKLLSFSPFSENNSVKVSFDAYSALSAIKNIRVFDSLKTDKIWIESVTAQNDKCVFKINSLSENNELKVFYGEIFYNSVDFMSDKEVDLNFYESGNSNIKATAVFDFSKFKAPIEEISGLSFEQTGIKSDCILEGELVLPKKIPIVSGEGTEVYFDNILLNSFDTDNLVLNSLNNKFSLNEKGITYNSNASDLETEAKVSLSYKNSKYSFDFINIDKDSGKGLDKTVLFIGDSLTNENYYTEYVSGLFQNDSMNIKLIGSRGSEGAKHEGRGGFSAYDYCNLKTLYGFDNPFLNNGAFDFSYYMKNNGYENVDYVFINLGINDLNKVGHNSHKEILSYYDSMIKSIRKFNPEVKIFIGTPILPFEKDSTFNAKNTRLNFIKALNEKYGDEEENSVFLVPLYLNLDPYSDYKFVEQAQSYNNANTQMVVNDATHPALSGYEKMAYITYCYIKYAASFE